MGWSRAHGGTRATRARRSRTRLHPRAPRLGQDPLDIAAATPRRRGRPNLGGVAPWATDEQACQFGDAAWAVTGSYLMKDLQARADLPSRIDATVERVLRLLREREHAVAIWEDALAQTSD